jgi:hypothetical protein
MDRELICTWLNITSADWPPDHYTLLGLPRGEGDLRRIEQNVHDRLARLRCYQLSHPEPATAAMNLLAQAFSCLTNPVAKQTYDAKLLGRTVFESQVLTAISARSRVRESDVPTERMEAVAVATVTNVTAVADTAVVETLPAQVVSQAQIDWQATAPPVRLSAPTETAEVPVARPADSSQTIDPLAVEVDRALSSRAARRGLATSRQLLERVWVTRQLLREWQLLGKTLSRLCQQQKGPGDDAEIGTRLNNVADFMRVFPRLLGRPGMPGYRVMVLRRMPSAVKVIQDLDAGQRKALAKDWLAGHTLLLGYRRFLLRKLRLRRATPPWARAVGSARALLADHAGVILTILGVILLVILVCYFT